MPPTRGAMRIGRYVTHLARWLRYFPLEQIHFVHGERLIEDPAAELESLQTFLGLPQVIQRDHFCFSAEKGFPCIRRPASSEWARSKSTNRKPPSKWTMTTSRMGLTNSKQLKSNWTVMTPSGSTNPKPVISNWTVTSSSGSTNRTVVRCLGKNKGRSHPVLDEELVVRRIKKRNTSSPWNRMFYEMSRVNFRWP